ncbi:MAG: SulP family inorganic anion transporter [cyanobacterium endosymbiont of Rhopalodia musculus]|uniref:SulP family inorganic anion transporter n=1 Tax=cyanobacterium endosymbiont of Epithemia clementina EcSB TaxID=3034674 RepID=UPI0024813BD7|nr:SulP family inorganic anion transporter [cyanobacterium endosymbiont of Epithemia clementina EcSB]WGT67636.1 SulP family inorganic anion transporter [cyanobacterium endosymbiont of Epithemia clementina EcSB]
MSEIFTKKVWFSNVKNDIIAGTVIALALIPEAIAFSIVAGVDPQVGLYSSFCIATITAFIGGRPGMISATTGAMALLMTTLVKDYGLQYLLATTILTGILQIILGWIKLGHQMRFVPRAVMVGFVNALAVLIFEAQLPQFEEASWLVYGMVAMGLVIIYGLPRLTSVIPSPLVAIVSLTIVSLMTGVQVPTVGDMGTLPRTLPVFLVPEIPWNFETLQIILPYAFTLSLVGLLESFLTANVIDDLTDTSSNKNQEAIAQGIANIVTGFFGGMAGCAMIGQSVINIRSGGRARLSTLSAGIFLLTFILVFGDWIARIPMAALVTIMIMVSISTFNWNSIRNITKFPKSETAVMITTVLITVLTHNLAIGVLIGVAMSAIFFSRKIASLIFVDSLLKGDGTERVYSVNGQIFFVSVDNFISAFDFREKLRKVTIDLTHAHLWDHSAVDAVDKVVLRFRKHNIKVDLIGLNEASATLIERLAVHDKLDAPENDCV